MTSEEKTAAEATAKMLGVPFDWFYRLVKFESGWNPQARNPRSSAKGLIQFTDRTARSLGYASSEDLIRNRPTIQDQLPIVMLYLRQFKPFPTLQSLVMAVFYPAARYWPPDQQFPDSVQAVNPGITCPADYVRRCCPPSVMPPVAALVAAAAALLYFVFRRGV